MQAQASQVANQVASQLALSAHVAKAAQVAQATVQSLGNQALNNQALNNQALNNQQPVFPHPIAIPPQLAASSAMNTNNNSAPVTSSSQGQGRAPMCGSGRGIGAIPAGFSPSAASPPPLAVNDVNRRCAF